MVFARERRTWAERVGDQQQVAIGQAHIDETTSAIETLKGTLSQTDQT
ncbi:hypothetical protein PSAB6_50055 [Paraburkholderia sabiae]|nr:hypothetical protein PSAB6_50055 [Paraburkholderia sabiae]